MTIRRHCLKPGDVAYAVRREQAGDTFAHRDVVTEFRITVIDHGGVYAKYQDPVYGWTTRAFRQDPLPWRRWPPEWLYGGPGVGEYCYFCHWHNREGHEPFCQHPKARKEKARG